MSNSYEERKSGVNVKQMVQNTADQYPFAPQIAAIIELVANSLDGKASLIEIALDKENGTLEVVDNGLGMEKRQFVDYHDIGVTSKDRGKGIGFAGQGAKLALNFCRKVVSETWSSGYGGYSEWHLKGNEAPYKLFDGQPPTLDHFGTKVTLYLDSPSAELYTEGLIRETLLEHYFPLLDSHLKEEYRQFYEDGVTILLNNTEVVAEPSIVYLLEDKEDIAVTFYRRRKAHGIVGTLRNAGGSSPGPGVMICTYGKVIERTHFKKEPKEKNKIVGWIEAPYLIEAVTTDKCRFQKGNKAWEGFFRKAQTQFSNWLEQTGLLEKSIGRESDYGNLEQEINSILKNLPELSFFGSRTQRDVAIPDMNGDEREMEEGTQKVPGTTGGQTPGEGVSVYPGEEPGEAPNVEPGEGISATPRPRTVRGGISLTEDERPDLDQEAFFDGATVTINTSHPAYARAKVSGLLNYHVLKSVVLGLIEFSLEKDPEASYRRVFKLQQRFFKAWGTQ